MKTLLVGINASYSHTCLAVRSIYAYVAGKNQLGVCGDAAAGECACTGSSGCDISFREFTINQPVGDILRGIAESGADVVLFSTYIWNAEITCKLIADVKKVLPGAVIGAGGPEFGFAAEKYLKLLPELDFVVKGEGERVVYNLLAAFEAADGGDDAATGEKKAAGGVNAVAGGVNAVAGEKKSAAFNRCLRNVKGIYFRQGDEVALSGDEELICDLSELYFPYPELKTTEVSNKLFYYESSRGCPYSCAYCLSSVDKRVRFMPLDRVFSDLQLFLDASVPIVKFVDRTYNLQPARYISIWRYILEHHNGKTMFHFEIEAEYLTEEALQFLQNVPAGVMQFEIGVQSANQKTLRAVNRSENIEKLAQNIRRIPKTIHQHLDLIAGLPYEDLQSFGQSFNFVMSLKPDELQLGFLKILHGTQMERYAKENGWQWMEQPVYETFSTPYMSYADILFLKDIEVLVNAYWNSGVFAQSMAYIGRTVGFWEFFCLMVEVCRKNGTFTQPRRESYWFEVLAGVAKNSDLGNIPGFDDQLLLNLLKYDFILRGKQGNFPAWYVRVYDKDRHWELLEAAGGVKNPRLDFARSEYEVFEFDVAAEEPEKAPGKIEKLIKY